jgi:hypothetical protein
LKSIHKQIALAESLIASLFPIFRHNKHPLLKSWAIFQIFFFWTLVGQFLYLQQLSSLTRTYSCRQLLLALAFSQVVASLAQQYFRPLKRCFNEQANRFQAFYQFSLSINANVNNNK